MQHTSVSGRAGSKPLRNATRAALLPAGWGADATRLQMGFSCRNGGRDEGKGLCWGCGGRAGYPNSRTCHIVMGRSLPSYPMPACVPVWPRCCRNPALQPPRTGSGEAWPNAEPGTGPNMKHGDTTHSISSTGWTGIVFWKMQESCMASEDKQTTALQFSSRFSFGGHRQVISQAVLIPYYPQAETHSAIRQTSH